jgi:ribonuclease HI
MKNRRLPSYETSGHGRERYHGGPVYFVGNPCKYRGGRGICKSGESREKSGSVRIIVQNGRLCDASPVMTTLQLGQLALDSHVNADSQALDQTKNNDQQVDVRCAEFRYRSKVSMAPGAVPEPGDSEMAKPAKRADGEQDQTRSDEHGLHYSLLTTGEKVLNFESEVVTATEQQPKQATPELVGCSMPGTTIYTDGATVDAHGLGGWAYVIATGNRTIESSGTDLDTTNNRMKIRAAIEALKSLQEPSVVQGYSDASYLIDGITSWILSWKASRWMTKSHNPVANRDLWEELDDLCRRHQIRWERLSGQNGGEHNQRVHALANSLAGITADMQPWWISLKAQKPGRTKHKKPQPISEEQRRKEARRDLFKKVEPFIKEILDLKDLGWSFRKLARKYQVPKGIITFVIRSRGKDVRVAA